MQRGYLKLWRKIMDHRVYQNADLLKLFLHLLMSANIVDKTWNGEVIRRGELACGREGLARDLREKPSTIYKRLTTIAGPMYGLITLRSNNRYTVITIVNYDTYQPEKLDGEQQGNNEVAAKCQQGSTTKELKNERRREEEEDQDPEILKNLKSRLKVAAAVEALEKPARKTRTKALKTTCPEDFEISEAVLAYCRKKGHPDPKPFRDSFVNYWQGRGDTRADWSATFRNYMDGPFRADKMEAKYGSQNGGSGGHSRGYESAAQRNARKLFANLGLDQQAGDSPTAVNVVLPLLPSGTAGGSNAGC